MPLAKECEVTGDPYRLNNPPMDAGWIGFRLGMDDYFKARNNLIQAIKRFPLFVIVRFSSMKQVVEEIVQEELFEASALAACY
ncbi:MAG: hypothetical protein M1355_03125 [Patescibacteria group bacterium]|nr:hypothetical protein [Patescibacteria group bacterium]